MSVTLSQQFKPYPRYLYHRDHNEPKVVISKAEEAEFSNKGWIATYVHKEYPKMVDGKIVNSHAEEERLIVYKRPVLAAPIDMSASADELFMGEDPPVIKETQIEGVDTAVIEKPKKSVGRPKKK